jgi:hypothetical protein
VPRQAAIDLGVYSDDTDNAVYAAYRQRVADPNNQQTQDDLAPLEHEQFVREVTQRNPVAGAAVMIGSSAYSGAKMLAESGSSAAQQLVKSVGTREAKTSKASMAEIGGAMYGFGRGLKDYFRGRKK